VARNERPRRREGDDDLELTFHRQEASVLIAANVAEARPWLIPAADFQEGVVAFVEDFFSEASRRIPDVVTWKDLSVLQQVTRLRPPQLTSSTPAQIPRSRSG
jgi:hypothetical protein